VVDRAELPRLAAALPVISTRLVGGRTRVRVLADSAPDSGFTTAEPELEDVYFAVRRGLGSVAKAA
jgi:hypothetical protein